MDISQDHLERSMNISDIQPSEPASPNGQSGGGADDPVGSQGSSTGTESTDVAVAGRRVGELKQLEEEQAKMAESMRAKEAEVKEMKAAIQRGQRTPAPKGKAADRHGDLQPGENGGGAAAAAEPEDFSPIVAMAPRATRTGDTPFRTDTARTAEVTIRMLMVRNGNMGSASSGPQKNQLAKVIGDAMRHVAGIEIMTDVHFVKYAVTDCVLGLKFDPATNEALKIWPKIFQNEKRVAELMRRLRTIATPMAQMQWALPRGMEDVSEADLKGMGEEGRAKTCRDQYQLGAPRSHYGSGRGPQTSWR